MNASVPRPCSSPLRRSCQTCASAKVKCTQSTSEEGAKCDRCRRLNKDCALQPIVDRKPRARKKTTRVAQLEQKLDGLVNLLTAKENGQPNPYPSPESGARASAINSPSGRPDTVAQENASPTASPLLGFTRDPGYCFRALSPSSAQHYLEMFQSRMAPYFPFVIIPPDMSAERLRLEKPALFGAIVVASSYEDIKQQTVYGESLLRHFIEELIIKGEKNLDLLQALLVYISWYHFIQHIKKRLTHLISLAAALVTDLGLARANPFNERLTITLNDTKGTYGCTSQQGVRTLDERRAYAGVFYIASCISTCFRELHTMKLTAYLEDCCTALESVAEYPTDIYLVQLTRLQALVERIAHAFQYTTRSFSRQVWKVPIVMYISLFDREFDDFLKKLSPELQQNPVLMMHYYNARGYLYEVGLYEPPQTTFYNQPSFRRMEILFACLQSTKVFYDHLDQISPELYYDIPMMTWTQVTHTLVNLSKLCFLDADDWSVSNARQVLDLSKLLDYVATRFETARAIKSQLPDVNDHESDMFSRFARRMRIVSGKYSERIALEAERGTDAVGMGGTALLHQQQQQQRQRQEQEQDEVSLPQLPALPQIPLGDFDNSMEVFAQLDDDEFWRGVMGNWNVPQTEPVVPERNPPEEPASEPKKIGYENSTCSAAVN